MKLATILLPVAAAAVVLGWSTQAIAGQATSNLVANGDAEAGPAATTDSQIVTPTGWTTSGSFTAVQYGKSGLPDAPASGGANLFAGGPGSSLSSASQTIDVSSSAAAIDSGAAEATLSALLGGWQGQEDSATVRALFVGANESVIDSFAIGPVTASDRGDQTALLPRSGTAKVPMGTRTIRVVITAQRASGVYNDGYADNVSLTLATTPPATVGHYAFGFRVFNRTAGLSAGTHGTFDTRGQPGVGGNVKVVKVSAKDLRLSWRQNGSRVTVILRFRGNGTYEPAHHVLSLGLVVRSSSYSGCRVGGRAHVLLDKPGDVRLAFCGGNVPFRAPARASGWVKQR